MSVQQHFVFQNLEAISDEVAGPEQAELFSTAKANLGLVPNMYRSMANSPALLRSYLKSYSEFREHSKLSPIEQEVVFLAISKDNGCQYCLAAHSMIADKVAQMPAALLSALRSGEAIDDSKLSALRDLTIELNQSRGRPSEAVVAKAFAEGYEEEVVLAILVAISAKTLSNYSNHLFANKLDDAFMDYSLG
ncbi:MAG: carboxymuconolactone decarboxylase family protein [Cellvibrionaceae bacterium]|nr:carboxymuconolactone decarboxylase family protein [Cellvibrionaceae bacterium]